MGVTGGVGERGGDGPCGGSGDGDRFDGFHTGVLLTVESGVASVGGGVVVGFGFGVTAEDSIGSSFIGDEGRVFTNFRSYDDLICLGSVGSGFGSARNMRFRRSLVQYWSSGVDRSGSSSFPVRAAGSTRTAC